jgi:hypothetical protein
MSDNDLTPRQIRRRQYYQENKAAARRQSKEWLNNNRERARATRAKWKANNRDKIQAWGKKCTEARKATGYVYDRTYYIANKDRIVARAASLARITKQETMDAYSPNGGCVCCGEKQLEFLSLDHIYNDGNVHRKQLGSKAGGGPLYRYLKSQGFPQGRFQTLCYNCQMGKLYNGGVCPHQKLKVVMLRHDFGIASEESAVV